METIERTIDFADIRGQEAAKRAALIAMAGNHPILFYGCEGTGKSMLREACNELCPQLQTDEMLPCPCGRFSDPRLTCSCEADHIKRHIWQHRQAIKSAEIHVECNAVPVSYLFDKRPGTDSATIRKQLAAFTPIATPQPWELDNDSKSILKQAFIELGLSVGQVAVILSVAATIAGLGGESSVKAVHVAEAIQYRRLCR